MKKIFSILLFSLTVLGQEVIDFTTTSQDLHDATTKKIFLDPHNHTGGILPTLATIDANKFIAGKELSLEELKDFWFKLVDYYKTSPLHERRTIANGTKLVLNCNAPALYCTRSQTPPNLLKIQDDVSEPSENPQCKDVVLDSIYNVLSATPLTNFQTAYSFRGNIGLIPDLAGASSGYAKTRAKILEIAKTQAGLVELSEAFIGGSKGDESTEVFSRYKEILDDLRKEKTSRKNRELKNRFTELGLKVPVVKWLLLTHTLELGKITDSSTLTYEQGQCLSKEMPQNLETDPVSGLYSTLLNFEDVVGVDVAGPEVSCFAVEGMRDFTALALTTYAASKARQQNLNKKAKMIVRVHVGEGSPLLETTYFEDQNDACEEAKKFPAITKSRLNDSNLYVHEEEAQKNISYLLRTITAIKNEHIDIDDFIIFRFGHVTHLTKQQAETMKRLGITADVNLSSNLATQSLPVDRAIIDEYLVKKGVTANKVRSIYDALVENGAPIEKVFNSHGLKWLLIHDVPTILGTDGSGVEHTPSLSHEYKLAEKLIEHWNTTDDDFRSKENTIDELLRHQKDHYDAMGY